MTAFSGTNRNGPPMSGRFVSGDTYTDAAGSVYEYVKTGRVQGRWLATPLAARTKTSASVGVASGTGCVATEFGGSGIHQTLLTLTDTPVAVADATQFGGTKIYTFPEGRVLVLGVTASLAPKTTTAIASTINSGVTGALGIGSATASNISLTGAMVDLLPSTAIVTSTVINVAAAAVTAALAASAQFDGTSAAKAAFLNTSITTATDIDADGTIAYTGAVNITWVLLGDY